MPDKVLTPQGARMKCPRCDGTGEIADDRAVGERLRAARLNARLTLREIARRLGYTPSYVCDLELGRRRWSPDKIQRFEHEVGT